MTEIYLSYSFPTKVSCFSFFSRKFVFDMNFFIKSNVRVGCIYRQGKVDDSRRRRSEYLPFEKKMSSLCFKYDI